LDSDSDLRVVDLYLDLDLAIGGLVTRLAKSTHSRPIRWFSRPWRQTRR